MRRLVLSLLVVSMLSACGGGGGSSSGGGSGSTGGGSGSTGGGSGSTGGGSGSSGGGMAGIDAGPFFSFVGFSEQVPVPANETCDLELDSMGRAHVVSNYSYVVDGGLHYSVRELDGGWTTERIVPVVGTNQTGTAAKIEIDSAGKPHVAFIQADQLANPNRTRLFYASKPAGTWEVEEIEDAGFQVSVFFSFQLDSTDTPRLTYRIRNAIQPDGGNQNSVVQHATRSTGAWTRETVHQQATATGFDYATNASLDSTGAAHVYFMASQFPDGGNSPSYFIAHATKSASAWNYELAYGNNFSMSRGASAVGPNDELNLVAEFTFFRKGPYTDGGWAYGGGGSAGNSPVMRTAPNGAVWDFTNTGSSSGGMLTVGRYVNGVHVVNVDAGVGGVRFSGWDFDSNGHPWGAVAKSDGVYLIRLD
ncbi:MAG: hypothetical protein K1X89_31250 [Myxococcaceae bacterium]|nr:hypothetical protein [Myxococcaceae bacterium]